MAFYDAVRQGQRINDSFHDEHCRIKLSLQTLKSRCCLSLRRSPLDLTNSIKNVAGQATCNNISLSLPRSGTQFNANNMSAGDYANVRNPELRFMFT